MSTGHPAICCASHQETWTSRCSSRLSPTGRAALASADPERAAGLLGEALGLWRGPLLADVLPSPLIEAHADRAGRAVA